MKISIWYSVEEMLPPETGYYLSFVGSSLGRDLETGYNYYNKEKNYWSDYQSEYGRYAQPVNVTYWTDADPFSWNEEMGITRNQNISESEKLAWNQVIESIKKYHTIKNLSR